MTSLLCSTSIWGLLVLFFLAIAFATQDGLQRLRRLHQIPCDRCAFFSGDYRLKCTVHPCQALTEAAIACRDFEPALPPARSLGLGFTPALKHLQKQCSQR